MTDQSYERCAVQFLLNRNPNNQYEFVGELATSYKYSPDYKSLTLTLRQGVKFQDGTDFNAQAVAYCLNLHWKGIRKDLASVTSIDIVDDYTIRLNLTGYDIQLLGGLASLSGTIVSPTALKTMGNEAQLHPVGTGPYKFVSYQTDVSLKYERFDGYWGGKPYLDGIEFVFIKDPITQLMSFKTGEAQVLQSVEMKDAASLVADGKYDLTPFQQSLMGIIGDSAHSDSPFSNIKVRQAISYALDNEAIAKSLGYGFFKGANQWFPQGNPAYNPAVVGYPYNPDKAKQLLSEAGYPKGFDTKITFQTTALYQNWMLMVQGYLSAVGIKATLDAADPARFSATIAGEWKNGLVQTQASVGLGIDPVTSITGRWTSKASIVNPKCLYLPADYEAKVWQASSEPDTEKFGAIMKQVSKMMVDDYCIASPMWLRNSILAKYHQVHDFDLDSYGINEWRPERAWLSK